MSQEDGHEGDRRCHLGSHEPNTSWRQFGAVSPMTPTNDTNTPRKQVRPAGLEPATLGLEIPCSIRLSYGRVCLILSKILRIILGNAKTRRNSDRAGFTGQGVAADYRGRSYDFSLEIAGLQVKGQSFCWAAAYSFI